MSLKKAQGRMLLSKLLYIVFAMLAKATTSDPTSYKYEKHLQTQTRPLSYLRSRLVCAKLPRKNGKS